MLDKLSFDVLIRCILPYLQDAEKRSLYSTCHRIRDMIHHYCLADKTPIEILCQREELLIIYKRNLIVTDKQNFWMICRRGYINLVKRSIEFRHKTSYYDHGMVGACHGGHRKIVKLMIKKGANHWSMGLQEACYGGHREIVDMMITLLNNNGLNNNELNNNGLNNNELNNNGLNNNELNNNRLNNNELNNNGLNNNWLNKNRSVKNWNYGLRGACRGGHREIIDLMISLLGSNVNADSWSLGLAGACEGGHIKIVNMMAALLGDQGRAHDWNRGLFYCCKKGHYEIVDLMIKKGATECGGCYKTIGEHHK